MNALAKEKQIQILKMLLEGNSLRSTSRVVGVSINTVTKLLVKCGHASHIYQTRNLRNLQSKRIECDEIWSFCYAKDKNLPAGKEGGTVWTWTAIDPDSKLIAAWHVGDRHVIDARIFLNILESRLANRVQLTTDGWEGYRETVRYAFKGNVDYGMIVKMYGAKNAEDKYKFITSEKRVVNGSPSVSSMSTSHVERANLTMRTNIKRFARKTNGFSKKMENHKHSVALHFFNYNFIRVHGSIKTTPAIQAGLTDRLFNVQDILDIANEYSIYS